MASKLSSNDKELLTKTLSDSRVGTKPYENGIWGTDSNRDFAFIEILDSSDNPIEYKNAPASQFVTEDGYIKFYPGSHLRSFGYQGGTFNLRYNFLRKMAGDDSAVLVHTLDKDDTKIGDIYTNTNNIYITEDGIVYAGSEENYKNNPTTTEQLKLEDLTYIIDEISSDRTEVRLKTKKINGSYIDEFVSIQTPIKVESVTNNISFQSQNNENLADSTVLQLSTPSTFVFKQNMTLGTITIPNVFKVNEITTPVRTNSNAFRNPNGELLDSDSFGNIVTLGDSYEWDSALHSNAVSVQEWSNGYLNFGDTSDTFFGTSAVGYHAFWSQNEGVVGGVCMKFTDMNEPFTSLDEWPTGEPYRKLSIHQQMSNLQGQGISNEDVINIRCDIRSTVAEKGVQIAIRYANDLLTEDIPVSPPAGYFNPFNPGPTEIIPSSPPPGYVANNAESATQIESKPPSSVLELRTLYPVLNGMYGDNVFPTAGQTTSMWGGAGAWRVGALDEIGEVTDVNWIPNLTPNLLVGALSIEGQYEWNGNQWVALPQYINLPTPPNGTVLNIKAVNNHPYQEEGVGNAKYPRNTRRGENAGWQTGTNESFDKFILFKDDLVWQGLANQNNDNSLEGLTIEEWVNSSLFRNEQTRIQGEDGIERSLYDDIFENGFIQTVTRAQARNENRVRSNHYILFYNDGRGNSDTSNKVFQFLKGSARFQDLGDGDREIKFLNDLSPLVNDEVNDNDLKFEVSFHRKSGNFFYYFMVGNRVHRLKDTNGRIIESNFETNSTYPGLLSDVFPYLTENPDALFPKDATHNKTDWSQYSAIVGDTVYKAHSDTADGAQEIKTIQQVFYNAGITMGSGEPLTYGVRNPGALNYGVHDDEGEVIDSETEPMYDNGTAVFDFDPFPTKDGALSPLGLWIWNGSTGEWVANSMIPAPLSYVTSNDFVNVISPETAGSWETKEVNIPVPPDMLLDKPWYIHVLGDGVSSFNQTQGVVWVDNLFVDFTLRNQSVTEDVRRPYTAQILEVLGQGDRIRVDKSFKQKALSIGVEDSNPETDTVYDVEAPVVYDKFRVSYTNQNVFDLRTYLKFENELFLITNFKKDDINVLEYPNSVVYKMYQPLPSNLAKFDECIVVKEMSNPLQEKVNIVDFIPAEEGRLVLRSADLNNVESPVQARKTGYKSEADILTSDENISEELRNQFLSQSLDSVKVNTDYSQYENFVNFSSVETRVRNFRTKLENIEEFKTTSASYIGVSGSLDDLKLYHNKILDVKNNFDDFEKYMYNESSSYSSGSLGIFYDNAWPKASGNGTLNSPYVLAHTTSSQATNWFSEAISSSSLYDNQNENKLSNLLPEFVIADDENKDYLKFVDMISQHFDHIWEYINALSDTFDRRDKLDEGISKDLLYNVAKSLGWNLNDGKDLVSLPRYALGKEVTGSAYSDYSNVKERDISREIWSRIINNMPFFLKNKGTVRALKGLINIYGIPSTILRIKEFGGPALPDNATPQFEITRKFTKALDFRGSQYVKTSWSDDSSTNRKPDSVELRFKTTSGSNQMLVRKVDNNNQDWIISLKKRDTQTDFFTGAVNDNYGFVSFKLSGSKVGIDQGDYKEITSSALPIYDGDFYSVMVRRTSGSSNVNVSQSYELYVGKYDSSRSKIHLYSTSSMDVSQAASASFSNAWTGSGNIYIGGSGSLSDVGGRFSGSIMEYRHWTETLNTSSFKNHIANPKAYDGNSVSSSYENLVLRYSMNDNKNLNTDTAGIRDVSSNQTTTLSGSHEGFTGNFFSNVVDELKSHIPSIGALRRSTDKIRIESNPLKDGYQLRVDKRSTESAFDTAPNDSNKVGIWFSPTDVINNDIINSVGDLNFDNYLGDPRDKTELSYRELNYIADNYWKKYTAPNNFWDYMRMIKYYDQSMYTQIRNLIPARVKPDIGLLVEPNIFERPKVVNNRGVHYENTYYSSSVEMTKEVIEITSSYNAGVSISDYNSYTGKSTVFTYDTGSVLIVTGSNLLKEASGSGARDRFLDRSIFQVLTQPGDYSNVTMSGQFGDTISGSKEVLQPIITGSRKYNRNQKTMNFYTSSDDAVSFNANSSSFYFVDLDNLSDFTQARFNSFYKGVKNTQKTTTDNKVPIEVIISSPTKLVTTSEKESSLTTGDGIVPEFKEKETKEPKKLKSTGGGLKKKKKKIKTDRDKSLEKAQKDFDNKKKTGKLGSTDSKGNSDKFK